MTTHEIIGTDVFFEIVEPEELEYTYRLRMAKDFGVTFPPSFKRNVHVLVPTQPRDACTKIRNVDSVRGNIAFVERGECSFLHKALMAERAGAEAVIVTDPENAAVDDEYYIEMVHDKVSPDVDANIPVAYLLGKNGYMILKTLRKLELDYAIVRVPVNLTFIPPQLINHPPWLRWWMNMQSSCLLLLLCCRTKQKHKKQYY